MLGDVTRSGPFDSVAVNTPSMEICGEYFSFVFVRPLSSLVDHHSAMGVSAPRLVGT